MVMREEEHERYNNQLFKRWAPIYERVIVLVFHIRRYVARGLSLPAGARVLDVACGTGAQLEAFAKRGFSVTGVDLSPDMLARAERKLRGRKNVTLVQCDAMHLPFDDAHFDASSIAFALHDMPGEMGIAVLREMRRVTKPHSSIIIVDYHRPRSRLIALIARSIVKLWETQYYDRFMERGLHSYLDQVGLHVEKQKLFMLGNAQVVTCRNG